MALGALTLSTTSGVQGRAFQATINGMTTGRVEVLNDGSPGFSTVNGKVMSNGLPYAANTVVLREYEPGVGAGYRDTRIDITATTETSLRALAIASLSGGRPLVRYRVAGTVQSDGTIIYDLRVEDDLGATTVVAAGGTHPPTPTPSPTVTLSAAISKAEGNSGTTGFNWTLTLNRDGSTASFPYNWAITGSGANPANAADFGGTFPSGSGTFAPGETSKTFTVLVMGDTAVEPAETFTLTVTAAGLNTVTSIGTISNDDIAPVAPTITSSASHTVAENAIYNATATANEIVTWTKSGTDAALVTLDATTGAWSVAAQDYETRTSVSFSLTATSAVSGLTAAQAVLLGITNIDDTAPIITSAATASFPEGSVFSLNLTANETVTWTKTGGVDTAAFTLTGNTLSLPAKDWEAPTDTDANNTYVVQVTATDAAGNAQSQVITWTVTNEAEGLFAQDLFTAPSNTNLTALTPAIGSGQWVMHPASAATSPKVDAEGRLYFSTAAFAYLNVAPASADYAVEAPFYKRSTVSGDRIGIMIRMQPTANSGYNWRYNETTAAFELLKFLNGTPSAALFSYPITNAVLGTKLGKISAETVGSEVVLTLYVDGVEVGTYIDSTDPILEAGFIGVRGATTQGSSTGTHLERINGIIASIFGAGIARTTYEPVPIAQPATLAALITQLGVSSGDVVDYATGNAGGAFASINAWLTACYNGGSPKIGALPSGTYSHASARQRAPRALYGYGATPPEVVESLTHSTTTAINWGNDDRVCMFLDIEDFENRHINWKGFGVLLGTGARYSQPLKKPSDDVQTTYPYAPSSTYKHLKMVNPRLLGAGIQTRRVGRVKFAGGTGTASALTALRVKPTGYYSDPSSEATNYYNDTFWAANTETVPVISSATTSGDPATVAASLIARINADTATTNTRAVAGRAVGEVYIIRDTLVPTATTGPEDYLHLYCTVTDTLTVESDTCCPSARFIDTVFTNIDTVCVATLDAAAPGVTEFFRCEGNGTWGFMENQTVRWDGGGARMSNSIWRDCIGARQQPASGVHGTGTCLHFASDKTAFNRLHEIYPTVMQIDRNTGIDIESLGVASSANANCAVFVDARFPSPISNGTVNNNKIHRVKNLRGAEDSQPVYIKALGGGVEIGNNWIRDCGAAFYSSGNGDGSECTGILIKEGAHRTTVYVIDIHDNLIEDMPLGIPQVKIDQQLCRVRVRRMHFKNWRNIFNGVTNTDATHAGIMRFTEKAKQIEIEQIFLENIDMAGSFLLFNFHNLKCTAASGLISYPDSDFSTWKIANIIRQNDGSANYPALTGDQPEFRFNGSLPTGALDLIRTGFNRRLSPTGVVVGASQIMRDSTTSGTYAGTTTEAEAPFLGITAA